MTEFRKTLDDVQFTQSCPTLYNPMNCSTPGLPVHHQLPESTQTHVHWVGDAIQPSHPLLSPWFSSSPQYFPASGYFPVSQSALCIRWPKYWSFNFSISPSNEHVGLISFRMNWLDLLAVQGTLKSLLQHHSSKPSILWHSAFFIVQISHPYMTTGKTIALTRWTSVDKVMSLLFNMLSMGSLRVGHDWVTSLSLFTFTHWRRKWQPTPVSLPGESQGRGSLVGCHLWGCTKSDTTEVT